MERVSSEPSSIKTLLLVEDNLATASELGKMLAQQAGYQVIVASDCLTALKFLRSFKPDLMLLDERLLTRNGIDLLPRLHVMKDLQDIPLLLLSSPVSPMACCSKLITYSLLSMPITKSRH